MKLRLFSYLITAFFSIITLCPFRAIANYKLKITGVMGRKLPEEQVEWVARLAHIALTEPEKSKYAEELSAVLGYVEELQQVDTTKVDEVMQITGLKNVTEADKVGQCGISREEFLRRAPKSERGYIKVKSVFNR